MAKGYAEEAELTEFKSDYKTGISILKKGMVFETDDNTIESVELHNSLNFGFRISGLQGLQGRNVREAQA